MEGDKRLSGVIGQSRNEEKETGINNQFGGQGAECGVHKQVKHHCNDKDRKYHQSLHFLCWFGLSLIAVYSRSHWL